MNISLRLRTSFILASALMLFACGGGGGGGSTSNNDNAPGETVINGRA